jgi:hypothetical protein
MSGKKVDHSKAIPLYNSGMSVEEVARVEGITRTAMYQWLKSHGVKFRPQLRHGEENHFYRGGKTRDKGSHHVIELALNGGKIEKVEICEICGYEGKFKDGRSAIQAHHPNYNEPYNVMWLCQKCHHAWHKNHKAIKKGEV